jgi:hypothetical protein
MRQPWLRQIEGQVYASDKGRKLEPNNLKGTKLGSPSWESGLESGPHRELRVRIRSLLRAAQGPLRSCTATAQVLHSHSSGLAQPQLRAAYSSLRLQSRVLRSQSGNGIWRGQDSGMDIVGNIGTFVTLSSIHSLGNCWYFCAA